MRYRLLCLAFTVAFAGQVSAATIRNVLFIMADDLRPELATYGSAAITPNLDKLAGQALQFDRAYCQQSVCNPSRSSMLTGRRPDTLHLWSNGLHFRENNPDVTTLPKWFKEHGHVTRCVGKIFHNWHTEIHGDPTSWSAPEFLHYANHGHDKPVVDGKLPPDHATAPKCECRDVPDEAYYDGRVAAEAVRVMEEIKDEPFFLAVGFWKPHAPFNAPKKYWDMYDRDALPELDPRRPEGAPEIAFHDSREILGIPPDQIELTDAQAAEIRHGYLANVAYMDAQLGKVLDTLDRLQLADETLVLFVGDHGYHIGEHGLWAKTSNFEFDARVPLMVSLPGDTLAAGKRTDALVELVDLFPTLVDLFGLPKPRDLAGTSLKPILENPQASVKTAAFSQHPRPAYFDRTPKMLPEAMGLSVRTARFRYTEWRDWETGKLVGVELYDHKNDPAEMHNRVDDLIGTAQARAAVEALHAQFPPGVAPADR